MAVVSGHNDIFTALDFTWHEDGSYVQGMPYKLDLISEVYVSDTPPIVKDTEAQLREMMRDPRYWQKREPEWVKRVTEGFRTLVGGDTPPSLPDRATVPFKIMVPETKTLRDEFAMALMDADDFMVGFKEHAEQLYRAADAMMEARKK
jgi:hypothetical protein